MATSSGRAVLSEGCVMSADQPLLTPQSKHRLTYAVMLLTGTVFVSTLFLPVSKPTAQLVATLAFGLMSGLWVSHLIYSL